VLDCPAPQSTGSLRSEPSLVIDVAKPGQVRVRRATCGASCSTQGTVGHDPGAIGPTGLREKDVALDIAHRAAPLIARELESQRC